MGTDDTSGEIKVTEMQEEKVKGDGNCLFYCASLALLNTVENPQEIRKLVSSVILNDPETFTKAELGGRDPQEYVEWLCGEVLVWGGIPELKALSIHFQTEFAVVITSDLEIEVYGTGKGYQKRVYLLYDGSHYNLAV